MPLQARTVRLSARLWEVVDALAYEDGVSAAEIVREAVVRLVERTEIERERKQQHERHSEKRKRRD